MLNQYIKNLKIVELAGVLAGPAVGMFFAELGADVIKLENKTGGGDVTRKWKLPTENQQQNVSAYFASVNYRKQYRQIDLTLASDKSYIIPLLKDADVVIVNFKKGDDIKFGLDYEAVQKINPAIIYAHITGYGTDNDKTAFDVVLQAETGYMHMTGHPGGEPVKMPVAFIDLLAAHQLKEAVLLALLKKQLSGKGSYVHVSLYETAVASLANQASNFLMAGYVASPMGSLHPNIAPYGEILHTQNGGQLVLAVGSNAQFTALCQALGLPGLAQNPLYVSNTARVQNRAALYAQLNNAARHFTIEVLEQAFLHLRVPHGRINTIQQVFDNPLAQNMVLHESIDGINTARVSTIAFNQNFIHD